MSNVYYDPGEFGLTTVGEMDLFEPDYSFDILAVWKDAEGRFYLGTDSGCSCPSPFEDFRSLDALDGPYTAHEAAAQVQKLGTEHSKRDNAEADLLARIMAT